MARTNNLTNFLTDVAGAIKQKTGDNTSIPASNFDTEILAIPTQGTYQQKELTITTNGNMTLLPDTGYDGFSEVDLQINVPSGSTADATAQAKDIIRGKTAYVATGKVTGTFKGAKYFATEAEMIADQTAESGDYALIYNDTHEPIENGDTFTKLEFPETVVFDTAISQSLNGQLMLTPVDQSSGEWWDGMYDISSTGANMFAYGGSGSWQARYTSSDGITYTRTSSTADFEFSTLMTIDDYEGVLPTIGKFLLKTEVFEGGFYKYGTYEQAGRHKLYQISANSLTSQDFMLPEQLLHRDDGGHPSYAIIKTYHFDTAQQANVVDVADLVVSPYASAIYNDLNGTASVLCQSNAGTAVNVEHYDFSLPIPLISTETVYVSSTQIGNYRVVYNIDTSTADYIYGSGSGSNEAVNVTSNGTSSTTFSQPPLTYTGWVIALNQYTLEQSNQLLPGVTAYGKNGNITGSDTIYKTIGIHNVLNSVSGLDISSIGRKYLYGGPSSTKTSFSGTGHKLVTGTTSYLTYLRTNLDNVSGYETQNLYTRRAVYSNGVILGSRLNSGTFTHQAWDILTGTSGYQDSITAQGDWRSYSSCMASLQVNDTLGFVVSLDKGYVLVSKLENGIASTLCKSAVTSQDGYSKPCLAYDTVNSILYISAILGTDLSNAMHLYSVNSSGVLSLVNRYSVSAIIYASVNAFFDTANAWINTYFVENSSTQSRTSSIVKIDKQTGNVSNYNVTLPGLQYAGNAGNSQAVFLGDDDNIYIRIATANSNAYPNSPLLCLNTSTMTISSLVEIPGISQNYSLYLVQDEKFTNYSGGAYKSELDRSLQDNTGVTDFQSDFAHNLNTLYYKLYTEGPLYRVSKADCVCHLQPNLPFAGLVYDGNSYLSNASSKIPILCQFIDNKALATDSTPFPELWTMSSDCMISFDDGE